MAPIKFEEQIKEKLEERSIQPSNDAWQKLSERLDTDELTQTNRNRWWVGVAASIVLVVTIAFVFDKDTIEETPGLVDTEGKVLQEDVSEQEMNKELLDALPETINQEENMVAKESINESRPEVKAKDIIESKGVVTTDADEVVTYQPEETIENANLDSQETPTAEDIKVQEVVAQLKSLHADNNTISEEELDALLVEAQQDLELQNSYNEATNTVDASALLQEVEFELDKSFRDKVIHALGSSYVIVKDVISNRNDN